MKNKKISVFIISLILIIIIVSLFVIKYFIHNKNSNDIENINVINIESIESIEIAVEYGYPHFAYSYKIDFLNKSILNEIDDYNKNETFYTNFTDEDAELFIKQANLYGFFQWNKSYDIPNVEDGKGVDIFINFKDGSVRETLCYGDFPPNYDKMAEVFFEAFGLII